MTPTQEHFYLLIQIVIPLSLDVNIPKILAAVFLVS
jgi:hypothetical protein